MNIQTKYHGEVDITEDTILSFEKGIPGFPDEKKFTLLPLPDQTVVSVLQSVETTDLAFVIADPYSFYEKYDFALDDTTVELLQIDSAEDVSAFVILSVHDPFEASTANLQAPIIVNVKNNLAKQVIINDEKYKTKHPLFGQPAKG
ncbi:flagellar assembly protein FliW [Lederbergia lenta]|uniref:Flagellar assembly factor FliW n=1 Tax=Lederbergia lenta TaxID=1467 RepID=A0A2X4ZNK8_LEDLE|nr:flagellar assembly protein FliW [Lederbergia lenta]MEC2322898.1 flagellar assembly protein FliW [Lederbergia lenta]SQI61994.1 Flagellar assembly factor FliW [Lederbergia lenta]